MPGGSETILLLGLDEQLLALTRTALGRVGYRVLEAATRREAKEILARHGEAIRLIVVERSDPEPALSDLGSRVLVLADFSEDGTESLSSDADIIRKPFSLDTLTRTVRRILDRRDADVSRS